MWGSSNSAHFGIPAVECMLHCVSSDTHHGTQFLLSNLISHQDFIFAVDVFHALRFWVTERERYFLFGDTQLFWRAFCQISICSRCRINTS